MSTPDPTHRTLNLCFGAFHSVRVHLGLFCYGSKLGAKWAKLVQVMQKFVPQCRVRSFRKERTQSTPLDPELMFCCASLCLDAFGSISLLLLNSMQNGLNWCN